MKTTVTLFLLAAWPLAAQPSLAVSLNASTSAVIERGWPVLANVLVVNDSPQSLRIAPAAQPWVAAIRVLATDQDGHSSTLAFQPLVAPPRPDLALATNTRTGFAMLLAPEHTTPLAVGLWTVVFQLEVKDGTGWRGAVAASPVTLRVLAPGAAKQDEVRENRIASARILAAQKRYKEAGAVLREQLHQQPNDINFLRMAAELLEASGDNDRAYVYASRAAWLADREKPGRRDESGEQLAALRNRLWRKVLSGSGPSAAR